MNTNKVLAEKFRLIADALAFLEEENEFRIRAYEKAADVLEELDEDVADIYEKEGIKGLEKIPGIGERTAKKIVEFLNKGTFKRYEQVIKKVNPEILKLLRVPGIGPKTLKKLYKALDFKSVDDLIKKLEDIEELPGFSKKTLDRIKENIVLYFKLQDKIPLPVAMDIVFDISKHLMELEEVERLAPCGSIRRMKDAVGDIDILISSDSPAKIVEHFLKYEDITKVLATGSGKASVIVDNKYQVDIRIVPPESFGAALQYFTGSRQHNIKLRKIAIQKGYKLSEYGIFIGSKKVGGETEEEIYDILGMQYVPPEIREDTGEVELAMEHKLPRLISLKDIKGDLHIHTIFSDGSLSLEDLINVGLELGYEYIGSADHSKSSAIAGGLTEQEVLNKISQVRQIKLNNPKIRVLCGMEVDILSSGELDYSDETLKKLDYVIASVHRWKSGEDVTNRVLKAMENPYVTIIGHPTGRMLGKRSGYEIDMDAVLKKAAETDTILEINAFYYRLDLYDELIKKAIDFGVRLVINSDAHSESQVKKMMMYGVGQARRGWAKAENVINTYSYKEFWEHLNRKRARYG